MAELTEEQVRENFLSQIHALVRYWNNQNEDDIGKLEGLAFSILSILDGSSVLPSFTVSPRPHEDDKEFNKSIGEHWYPESGCDISGCLHEQFLRK